MDFIPQTVHHLIQLLMKIVWNLGTLPIAAGHPEYIYDLTFELNVTDDCSIILNTDQPVISFRNRNNIRYRRYIDYPYLLEISFQGYDSSSCHLPIEVNKSSYRWNILFVSARRR
jgi:hypothetical protein